MSQNQIETVINRVLNDASLPRIQEDLATRVENAVSTLGYTTQRMGSVVKHTHTTNSDIDILAELPNIGNRNGVGWLSYFRTQLHSLFNPTAGRHSLKISYHGARVDLIPGAQTRGNQWQIPDNTAQSNGYWVVRGHSQFSTNFVQYDSQIGRKLSASVKVLKMWNDHHPNFALTSLAIEKVCYDSLQQSTPQTKTESVIQCLNSLATQIQNNISHPGGGSQVNSIPNQYRLHASDVMTRNVNQLSNYSLTTWQRVFGSDFR